MSHPDVFIYSLLCMPFVRLAEAQEFKKKFEEAMDINAKHISAPAATAVKDESAAAADELAAAVADKL